MLFCLCSRIKTFKAFDVTPFSYFLLQYESIIRMRIPSSPLLDPRPPLLGTQVLAIAVLSTEVEIQDPDEEDTCEGAGHGCAYADEVAARGRRVLENLADLET